MALGNVVSQMKFALGNVVLQMKFTLGNVVLQMPGGIPPPPIARSTEATLRLRGGYASLCRKVASVDPAVEGGQLPYAITNDKGRFSGHQAPLLFQAPS